MVRFSIKEFAHCACWFQNCTVQLSNSTAPQIAHNKCQNGLGTTLTADENIEQQLQVYIGA